MSLPIPPPEMRALVGPTDPAAFDLGSAPRALPDSIPDAAYSRVLDFGCGCGRIARQLAQQQARPSSYLGIDAHRGMVQWCQANIAAQVPGFRFEHHDVRNAAFNPGEGKPMTRPFPTGAMSVELVIAISVFTHIYQDQTLHYLSEVERVLSDDGYLFSTWFLFDKTYFPMMQDFQNTLFINEVDPVNAVIYDRAWVMDSLRAAGLILTHVYKPKVRGFQWWLVIRKKRIGRLEVDLPDNDDAPFGIQRAAASITDAHAIGLG